MAILDFLFDDTAPSLGKQISTFASETFDKVSSAVGTAMQTPAGQDAKKGASVGLTIGVCLGTVILITGVAGAVVDAAFGRRS